ncbi:unnamed protein product [Choristocarpus tenellus]
MKMSNSFADSTNPPASDYPHGNPIVVKYPSHKDLTPTMHFWDVLEQGCPPVANFGKLLMIFKNRVGAIAMVNKSSVEANQIATYGQILGDMCMRLFQHQIPRGTSPDQVSVRSFYKTLNVASWEEFVAASLKEFSANPLDRTFPDIWQEPKEDVRTFARRAIESIDSFVRELRVNPHDRCDLDPVDLTPTALISLLTDRLQHCAFNVGILPAILGVLHSSPQRYENFVALVDAAVGQASAMSSLDGGSFAHVVTSNISVDNLGYLHPMDYDPLTLDRFD